MAALPPALPISQKDDQPITWEEKHYSVFEGQSLGAAIYSNLAKSLGWGGQ